MKHLVFSICMGIASMLIFSGCAGMKELNSAMADTSLSDNVSASNIRITKNKTTKNEVLSVIGAPSLVFKENGLDVWVYQRIAVRQSDAGFSTQGHFSAMFPFKAYTLSRGMGVAGVGASADLSANRSSYKSASLIMKFNKNGCVHSYEFTATSF